MNKQKKILIGAILARYEKTTSYSLNWKENGMKTWLPSFESRDLTEGKEKRNRRGFRQFPVDEIWLLAPNANFPVLINYSDREASSGAATKGEVNWIVGRKRG